MDNLPQQTDMSNHINEDVRRTYAKLAPGHQLLGGNISDIRRFLKSRHTKKALKIGAIAGTVTGAAAGGIKSYISSKRDKKYKDLTKAQKVKYHGANVAKGAIGGGLAGTYIGLRSAQTDAMDRGDKLSAAVSDRLFNKAHRQWRWGFTPPIPTSKDAALKHFQAKDRAKLLKHLRGRVTKSSRLLGMGESRIEESVILISSGCNVSSIVDNLLLFSV